MSDCITDIIARAGEIYAEARADADNKQVDAAIATGRLRGIVQILNLLQEHAQQEARNAVEHATDVAKELIEELADEPEEEAHNE